MESFDPIVREAIIICALLTIPVLLGATLTGTLVAIAQAATQVQEQTLTLLPKILAVAIILVAFGRFGFALCAGLFNDALTNLPAAIRAGP